MRFLDTNVFLYAIDICRRLQLSYWDGAIIAAAQALGCETIYAEDLNPGQHYSPVRALNPFAHPPPENLREDNGQLGPEVG